MQPVFRFAPSPNGHLHLGHAFSALLNARMAAETGGRFLIRIEDIDPSRCTETLVADCLDDLAWLGLRWEEPVLRQSTQFARYQAAAETLAARGLVFRCACTRGDIRREAGANPPRDPEGAIRYPGICRQHPAGEGPFAMRLHSRAVLATLPGPLHWRETGEGAEQMILADPSLWGDVVLIRKDTPASYHLAVALDDAMQGVTNVVRGRDLYAATAIHRLLQSLFGLPAPVYHHHALILDGDGKKLSKSAASTPLRQLRAEGMTASAIRRHLGFG